MPWTPISAKRRRSAPWPTVVLVIAGLALLYGYHYRIMKYEPPAWMLFLGVFLQFGGLAYWVRALDNRVRKLEEAYTIDRQRLQQDIEPSGESRTGA